MYFASSFSALTSTQPTFVATEASDSLTTFKSLEASLSAMTSPKLHK